MERQPRMSDVQDGAKVVVFALGGTIASSRARPDAQGITPELGVADLLATLPPLGDEIELEGIDFRRVPSGDLTFEDLLELAHGVEAAFARGARGVVVIQGTDTLEETAFALDLLVRGRDPVVVTGAMRSSNEVGHDGPANVLSALRVAGATSSREVGSVVVFNDEIHAARFVHKAHATSPSTFVSPSAGPLGRVLEGRVRWTMSVPRLASVGVAESQRLAPVALVRLALGDDARVLDQLAGLGFAGVVVEGFGGGHVPARVVAALEALNKEIPVVLASRTGAGEVLRQTYGYPGAEIDLRSRGLTFAGSLDGLKARVALTLALAAYSSRELALDALNAVIDSVTF